MSTSCPVGFSTNRPLPPPPPQSPGWPSRWLPWRPAPRGGRDGHPLHEELEVTRRRKRVLVAEDDVDMRTLVGAVLRRAGYHVEECGNGLLLLMKFGSFLDLGLVGGSHSFVASPDANSFDLIISDIRMPGATGLEVLERTRHRRHYPPIILMTAFGDEETHLLADRLGAITVLDKPFEVDELVAWVRTVVPA